LLSKKPVCYRNSMRRALLPLLVVPGCLYIGGINHAPEGEVQVESTSVMQGDWVLINANVSDPDGDELMYEWRVIVTPMFGTPHVETLDQQASSGVAIQPAGEGLSRIRLQAVERGSYEVELKVLDERHAFRELTATFDVGNQPPSISLLLDLEPPYKVTDRFPDTGFADDKVRNPAHAHYLLRLKEGASTDHEQDLSCDNERAAIKYELLQPAQALFDYLEPTKCTTGELLGRLRFRLDPTQVKAPSTVKIRVSVDDGYGGSDQQTVTLDVVPNRPACIVGGINGDGTSPPVPATSGAGLKVPVVASEGLRFEVIWPDDDVNEGNRYRWLVRDQGATGFEAVEQDVSGGRFQMPPWFRMPGQEIDLRVVISDQVGQGLPGCSDDTVLCQDAAADLPSDCYQWVTWRVTFL